MGHRFFRSLAIAVAVVAGVLIAVSYGTELTKQPWPITFGMHNRSVAVGVSNADDFGGMQWWHVPRIAFEIHNDLHWTISLNLAVYLPQPDTDLQTMPVVYMLMPSDVHDCMPGYKVGYNKRTGQQFRMEGQNSIIDKQASTADNVTYAVRPSSVTSDPATNHAMARYEILCQSSAPNTTSGGIGSTNFELQYLPAQAANAGLSPGFGGLRPGFEVSYSGWWNDDGTRDGVYVNPGQLGPDPTSKDGDVYKWQFPPTQTTAIVGTASKQWAGFLDKIRIWLIGAIAVAAVGLVIDLIREGNRS